MLRIKLRKQSNFSELDEGRKDDAIAFVNKISPEDTAKKQKYQTALQTLLNNPIADNKYILWMLKHLDETEDVEAMILAVRNYDMFQKNIEQGSELKDINNIKSFEDLKNVVADYEKSIKELEREGQKVIVSKEETGGRFEVIRPLNVHASCKVGRDAEWCIAATKSRNYYRQYSRQGVLFYVILDYSKPIRDKDSLFAYAINPKDIDKLEIYNAIDKRVERGQVAYLIGIQNEENFYQKMREEAGLGIQSTTLEKHNTFFTRFMKLINALPKYDKTNIDLNFEEDEKYNDMENEVGDYLEEWQEKYEDKNLPVDQRKGALRHMVLFAKKASDIDNILAKYRIGQKIKYDFVGSVPQLREPMIDLLRNPKWAKSAEQNFKQMSADFKEKDRYDLQDYAGGNSFFSNLFEYSEQAIYNNAPEYLDKFFDEFQNQRRKLDPNLPDSEQIYKINDAQESVTKAAVFNDHPSALKFLLNIIANNSYSLGTVHSMMHRIYNIAEEPERTKKYADEIFQFLIDKYKSSERYGAKLADLYLMILKTKGLPPSRYEEALKNNQNENAGVDFAYRNDINLLDLKYQEKVVSLVQKYFEMYASGYSNHTLANAMYGVCLSRSLSKEKISSMLEALFNPAYDLYRNISGQFRNKLIEMFADDEQIDSPNFKKFIEKQKDMYESKIFRYDSERKIYRILG